MRHRLRTPGELARALPGVLDESSIRDVASKYPMAISPYYLSLIEDPDSSDPIFRQCVPHREELHSPTYCTADPLQEAKHSPIPGLVHRYPDRVLSLASATCATYCRHCTRKRMAGVRKGSIDPATVDRHVQYIRQHPEVAEVIISGGDPLTMTTERLEEILAAFRGVPTVEIIRIGTRVPVTLPMRITPDLCATLEKHHPVWLCTHFNHPREVTPAAAEACDRLLRAGIPVLNQTVLLNGINDRPETMMELCRALLRIRVRPYYLYQCDLVQGVEHFRTPISRGIEIMEALRGRIGGTGIPQFVIDAPDGAGKIPVGPDYVIETAPTYTVLRNYEGKRVTYPKPAGLSHSVDATNPQPPQEEKAAVQQDDSAISLRQPLAVRRPTSNSLSSESV